MPSQKLVFTLIYLSIMGRQRINERHLTQFGCGLERFTRAEDGKPALTFNLFVRICGRDWNRRGVLPSLPARNERGEGLSEPAQRFGTDKDVFFALSPIFVRPKSLGTSLFRF